MLSAKMNDTKVMMERLNNTNWASWKFRMQLWLVKEGLWTIVEEPKPENATAAWMAKDASARAIIGLALDDGQLEHVFGVATANEMWLKLKAHHERGSLCNKIHVLRKLCSLRLREGGDMAKHLSEVSGLVSRLHAMGEKLGEHWVVAILLSSLPESYSPLITALEGRSEEDLKLEYVKGKLLDEWRRRSERDEDDGDHGDTALRASLRRRGHGSGVYTQRDCFYCHEEGHFQRDCPKLHRKSQEGRRGRAEPSGNGRGSREDDGRQVCFTTVARTDNKRKADHGLNGWIIDSGCTRHMTGDISKLENVRSCREIVKLADGREIFVNAKGTGRFIGLDVEDQRMNVKLKDVLHVPELRSNVLSMSCIIDEGYSVCFGPV